jgi:hypothetical protein
LSFSGMFWVHVMHMLACYVRLQVQNMPGCHLRKYGGGKNRNSIFELTYSFSLADLTFSFFHCSYLYNYYNYSRTLCMLSFRISYWDLIKFLNFADTTERGYRGWKQAQRHYDITYNQSCVFFFGSLISSLTKLSYTNYNRHVGCN